MLFAAHADNPNKAISLTGLENNENQILAHGFAPSPGATNIFDLKKIALPNPLQQTHHLLQTPHYKTRL